MKLPLSWLKEYIVLEHTPSQIARALTMAGLEVDATEKVALPFENVVVGKVLSVERHPNADKLVVAQVTEGKETRQVVCGAPNCREGLLTAFAVPGATLKDDEGHSITIKPVKLRGVESFGMLCAADELGLWSQGEGILEFPPETPLGASLNDLFSDWIFDISLTPNLGHCASVWGVVRELSASTSTPYKAPTAKLAEEKGAPIEQSIKVSVVDTEGCPRYASRLIRGVKVAPSPGWLRHRLEQCGMRSVNNVVDATNYVLLEMGHPLHAFDYDRLAGQQVVVRRAKEGELFTTLDGKERTLTGEMLLICDESKPVALAGIMGGMNSEVADGTTNILIESAYFDRANIRRTSKALGLQTEGSKRFERGADSSSVIAALDRVTFLIQELAGGEVAKGVVDILHGDFTPRKVSCRVSRVSQLIGQHFGVGEVEAIFKRLGFTYSWDGKDVFTVTVPSYRCDISIEEDLIEEVARLYGYENIAKKHGFYQASQLPHAPIYVFENEIRKLLMAEGLQEFVNCDLIGPMLLGIVQDRSVYEESTIRVLNPTSVEQSVLRQSLLPGLLQVLKFNFDRRNSNISGFEVGRVHFRKAETFKEQAVAAVVLTGKERPAHWGVKPNDVDFFDLKGMIENLLSDLRVGEVTFRPSELNTFHPGRQAHVTIDDLDVGVIGEVHPDVLRRLDFPQRIYFGELNLHDLFKLRQSTARMEELPLYPGSERDWTVTVPSAMPVARVLEPLKKEPSPLLENVSLLDIYQSDRLGGEIKNITLRFAYRDRAQTVLQEVVDQEHARLTAAILKDLGPSARAVGP